MPTYRRKTNADLGQSNFQALHNPFNVGVLLAETYLP